MRRHTAALISILVCLCLSPLAFAQQRPFVLQESTIATIHAAFDSKQLTCVDLVRSYLNRIEAYDHKGPALNALLTINPKALETAAALDKQSTHGPLYCIPLILKDNYSTADMPTSGGTKTLASSIPAEDATLVKRLRQAGAIVIGKANLSELANGGETLSSLGGQTRNPYDLTRTPGGSSGGTGASIAANFGVLGTGSDTGQSVRSPASANSLVGIRPTRGLLSRYGIIPNSTTQDEPGPITRTVEDAAKMLDVMAGYDPADPITAFSEQKIPKTYTASLDRDGLKGKRIGLLTDYLGQETVHQEVNAVVAEAVAKMSAIGATIVRITIPNLDALSANLGVSNFEYKGAFNRYLSIFMPNGPVKSLEELISRGQLVSSDLSFLQAAQAMVNGTNDPEYKSRLLKRNDLRQAVMTVMANNKLDAILYPHQRRLVATIGSTQAERNGVLSNSTGFPAIAFPGGFSKPSSDAPLGVPIGLELLGPEWSEPMLLKLTYAFEQQAHVRKSPASVPPLK